VNNEKMKELLSSGKIDSLERWKEVCTQARCLWDEWQFSYSQVMVAHVAGQRYVGSPETSDSAEHTWWMKREAYRQRLEVYPEMTEVLRTVVENFHLGQYCIHVSKDDPTMLAYTPSAEDGARDKQVRVSFGKLMRKLLILATDKHIQAMEASHRSELDPTFQVARAPEEIIRVYTGMDGDTGCMRYEGSQWGLKEGYHPAMAYAYAGLGVAFTEFNGIIKSRSVIYDNPDDPEDKRYVRIYGDPALKRKLERAGYRCDNLQGAKLRAVPMLEARGNPGEHGDQPSHYLLPYLDGAGGAQSERTGCYGYIVKGEDCIRLIDDKQASRIINALGQHVSRFKDTGARYHVPVLDPEQISFECYLSKAKANLFEDESVVVWLDGAERTVTTKAYKAAGYGPYSGQSVYTWKDGRQATIRMLDADWNQRCFSDHDYVGGWVLDTPENRRQCGQVLLSTEHGYEANTWSPVGKALNVAAAGEPEVWVRKVDTHMVFEADGTERYVLAAELDKLKATKEYVATAPKGKEKGLSHKANPRLHVTVGGRKCIEDWHDICELADGRWDYTTNTQWINVFGREMRIRSDEAAYSIRSTEAVMAKWFDDYIQASRQRPESLKTYVRNMLREGVNYQAFALRGDMLTRSSSYSDAQIEAFRAAVSKLQQIDDQALSDMLSEGYVQPARAFQHHAEILLRLMDAKLAEWTAQQQAQTAAVAAALSSPDRIVGRHTSDERFAAAA
jgi:hypothetical protein